jgi:hypothetical protein
MNLVFYSGDAMQHQPKIQLSVKEVVIRTNYEQL